MEDHVSGGMVRYTEGDLDNKMAIMIQQQQGGKEERSNGGCSKKSKG